MEGATEDPAAAEDATAGSAAAAEYSREVADPSDPVPRDQQPLNAMPPPRAKQPMGAPPARGAARSQDGAPVLQPPVAAPQASGDKARLAAVAAAAKAAAKALPAQRERAVAEAAASAYAEEKALQYQREASNGAASGSHNNDGQAAVAPPRQLGTYDPPDWAGVPDGTDYTLEVLRDGAVVDTRDLAGRDHYTMGRTPDNDVVLEHPSSSRLHAVIQFKAGTGEAFLYDAASAHGTFLNKRRLKPRQHEPLRVGDTFKLGQSTRLYLLGGPEQMMPEEGLSREQRKQLRIMQAKEARKEEEVRVGKAQMDAALAAGASWGFGEDAAEELVEGEEVDWRTYAETHSLTDNQGKLASKIRKKEYTMRSLQIESERIRAKGGSDELTAGQASTLARNEQVIDRLKEEVEDLDETLNESVRDSITGRSQAAREARAAKAERAKRRRQQLEDEEEAGSSDDDAFYDRTRDDGTAGAAAVPGGGGKRAKRQQPAPAIDAATLSAQREALTTEQDQLRKAIEWESLQAVEAATSTLAGREAAPADGAANTDALDAFMSNVATELDNDKVAALRKQLAAVEARLSQAEKLLGIADPDGFFKAGSAAAKAAVLRATQALAAEKLRGEAAEKRRKNQEDAARKLAEAADFVPEVEEDESAPAPARQPEANIHRLEAEAEAAGGLQVMQRRTVGQEASAVRSNGAAASTGPPQSTPESAGPAGRGGAADTKIQRPVPLAAAGSLSGPTPGVPVGKAPGGLQSRQQIASAQQRRRPGGASSAGSGGGASSASMTPADAQAAVAANLARLSNARKAAGEAGHDQTRDVAEEDVVWQPPEGQRGDGRTTLNEKLGY